MLVRVRKEGFLFLNLSLIALSASCQRTQEDSVIAQTTLSPSASAVSARSFQLSDPSQDLETDNVTKDFIVAIVASKGDICATKPTQVYEGCSGVITDSTHVLTSAGCYRPDAADAKYYAIFRKKGVKEFIEDHCGSPEFRLVVREIASFNQHPEFRWSDGHFLNDLAVATLAEPIPNYLTPEVKFQRLALPILPADATPPGGKASLAGYGAKDNDLNGIGTARKIDVTVEGFTQVGDTPVVTTQPVATKLCWGDSGAPLWTLNNGVANLLGIASRSNPDGSRMLIEGRASTNACVTFDKADLIDVRKYATWISSANSKCEDADLDVFYYSSSGQSQNKKGKGRACTREKSPCKFVYFQEDVKNVGKTVLESAADKYLRICEVSYPAITKDFGFAADKNPITIVARDNANISEAGTERAVYAMAHAKERTITLNTNNASHAFWQILLDPLTSAHELVHIAQGKDGAAFADWKNKKVPFPWWWMEGIAVYESVKTLNDEAQLKKLACGATASTKDGGAGNDHFYKGYECAAAFLAFVGEKYEPNIVQKLQSAISDGSYGGDMDFFNDKGTPDIAPQLEKLWEECRATNYCKSGTAQFPSQPEFRGSQIPLEAGGAVPDACSKYGVAPASHQMGTENPDQLTAETGGSCLIGMKKDDILTGSSGADVLLGGKGNDKLYGGDGDDVLLAGQGPDDYMNGGSGKDLYVFLANDDQASSYKKTIEDSDGGRLVCEGITPANSAVENGKRTLTFPKGTQIVIVGDKLNLDECGGGGASAGKVVRNATILKDAASGRLKIGTAGTIEPWHPNDPPVIKDDLSNAEYQNVARKHFNMLSSGQNLAACVIMPGTKPADLNDTSGYQPGNGRVFVKFATDNGMEIRGPMIDGCPPGWIESLSPDEVKTVISTHIKKVVSVFPEIRTWNVVNEAIKDVPPVPSQDSPDNLRADRVWVKAGSDYVTHAFQVARAANAGKLFYNDYNTDFPNDAKTQAVLNLVKGLKQKNLIDGIGFQSHVSAARPPSFADIMANFKQFADLGLEIHVSELDVGSCNDENCKTNIAPQIYYDYVAACKKTPACTAISVWGLNNGNSWIFNDPNLPKSKFPLLFDDSFNPMPAFVKMLEALNSDF